MNSSNISKNKIENDKTDSYLGKIKSNKVLRKIFSYLQKMKSLNIVKYIKNA